MCSWSPDTPAEMVPSPQSMAYVPDAPPTGIRMASLGATVFQAVTKSWSPPASAPAPPTVMATAMPAVIKARVLGTTQHICLLCGHAHLTTLPGVPAGRRRVGDTGWLDPSFLVGPPTHHPARMCPGPTGDRESSSAPHHRRQGYHGQHARGDRKQNQQGRPVQLCLGGGAELSGPAEDFARNGRRTGSRQDHPAGSSRRTPPPFGHADRRMAIARPYPNRRVG